MINYIQKFAGGKVSIEVSDPADIYKLSTLYADGSEARIVDVDAGIYRLINGVWTYVPGSGGAQYCNFIVRFNRVEGEDVADKTFEEVLSAYTSGMLIVFRDQMLGDSIAMYDGTMFKASFLYVDTVNSDSGLIRRIRELAVIDRIMTSEQTLSLFMSFPRIPLINEGDNGKLLGVSGEEYALVNPA